MDENPHEELPRDATGSYLHLKVKRFASIDDLKMLYAKRTWKDKPHDAEADVSPSSRSACRQCHTKIGKGELRMRLWLQCHKGCKNSTYFHGKECFWIYPETAKLDSLDEIVGIDNLPINQQSKVRASFNILKGVSKDEPVEKIIGETSSSSRKKRKLIHRKLED
jgi:hypothetical protein